MTRGGNTVQGRNKAKQTWLNKYGVTCPLKNKQIMAKLRNTCAKRYGCAMYTQTKEYHAAAVNRNLNNFLSRV